jgi:hypothetical protein
LDSEVTNILNDMEREYFWGALKKRLKKGAKGLLSKGLKLAKGKLPVFKVLQSMTQLARGDLKGLLGSLAKAGLASAVPGGAVALPALQALGFEAGQDQQDERAAWDNFARVAQESFEYLAENLTPDADQMQEAHRLAYASFRAARPNLRTRFPYRPPAPGSNQRGVHRITLRPGEIAVIRRGKTM